MFEYIAKAGQFNRVLYLQTLTNIFRDETKIMFRATKVFHQVHVKTDLSILKIRCRYICKDVCSFSKRSMRKRAYLQNLQAVCCSCCCWRWWWWLCFYFKAQHLYNLNFLIQNIKRRPCKKYKDVLLFECCNTKPTIIRMIRIEL